MDLKKTLNLNSYEWWRNHRRFVTLGIFLALFAGYVRGPAAKDYKVRDLCGRLEAANFTEQQFKKAKRQLGLENSLETSDFASYCSGYK
tara:strand:+ start:209 stop:475 length:267 start_codon:yes stop_codon:yes gene_type:complete